MKLNGLILFIVALLLGSILLLPLLIIGLIFARNLNTYLLSIAVVIDELGNVVGSPLFNKLFLLEELDTVFGDPKDTISYVLAVNKHLNNLTSSAKVLDWILNFLDPGHTDLTVQRAMKIKKWIHIKKDKKISSKISKKK